MNKINLALIRLLQFVVFAFFTFAVLVYVGAMVLLGLDLLLLLINALELIGIGGVIATVVSLPVVGYLGLVVYRTPKLCDLLVNIAVDLVGQGKGRIEEFNAIAANYTDQGAKK